MTVRLTANRIWQLSFGLSERDLSVVRTLSIVRVATVRQLERLHFSGQARTARRSMEQLAKRRIVARLPRQIGGVRAGSAGHIYALDVVGQYLAGSGGPAHGERLRRPWTPGQRFLDHALSVTEVYVALVEFERQRQVEVLEFQAEPDCWRVFSPMGFPLILKPDAYARLGFEKHEDSYFIEVDRATESVGTLKLKAEMYGRYFESGEEQHNRGVFPKVLWLAPDKDRAQRVEGVVRAANAETSQLHAVGVLNRPHEMVVPAPSAAAS